MVSPEMNKSLVNKKSESGQAIVLLMLVLVGLLAVAGLAVDGGLVYYGQRTAQNAADNAALAGALALCTGGSVNSTAFASAANNGFDNDGVTNTVMVNNPPSQGPNIGNAEYVEVIITSTQEAGFSQIVFSGTLQSTVRSVGHCAPSSGPPFLGDGIVTLDPDDACAFNATGNGSISVNGGSIFVNSNNFSGAMCGTGNAAIYAEDSIDIVGGWKTTGNANITPAPNTGVSPTVDPLASLAPPPKPGGTCISYTLSGSGSDTIAPGLYCSIKLSGNANLVMNPGIYYIEGGNVSISGGGSLSANGVMFYLDSGSFSITGNGDFAITAPSSGPYAGMMLFMDQSSVGTIKITGNGTVNTTGTIYGAQSNLTLSGNGTGTVLNAQIIVGTINVTGNGDLAVNYDANNVFQGGPGSPIIELAE